jgi:hypothetical protein
MCLSTWQVEASGYDELEGAARHKTYGRDAAMRRNNLAIPIFEFGVCSRGYLISPL